MFYEITGKLMRKLYGKEKLDAPFGMEECMNLYLMFDINYCMERVLTLWRFEVPDYLP